MSPAWNRSKAESPLDDRAFEGGDGGHDVVDRGLAAEDLLEGFPILGHAPHDFHHDGVAVHAPSRRGFVIGPLACSSRLGGAAVPELELVEDRVQTVGLFRVPFFPPTPSATFLPSAKPFAGSWQVAQDTVPSFESRLS